MNTVDRFVRAQEILALHTAEVSIHKIARQYNISCRQVSRIIREMKLRDQTVREIEAKRKKMEDDLNGGWI